MDIKSKNKYKKSSSFSIFISNLIFIFLPLCIFSIITFTYRSYYSYSNVNSLSDDIISLENSLSDTTIYSDEINYALWLEDFVKNTCNDIYSNFDNLKYLSGKNQVELNDLSKEFSSNSEKFSYNNLVKFIIIDKSSKKFITNSLEDINSITENIDNYISGNSSLFNFVYSKAAWYYISYKSTDSPFTKYLNKSIESYDNYAEAYWLPKSFKLSNESEDIRSKITTYSLDNLNKSINSTKIMLNNEKSNFKLYIIYLIISITLIIINIFFIFKIGFKNFIYNIKSNLIFSKLKNIKIFFESRTTLFKLIFLFLSNLLSLYIIILFSKNISLNRIFIILLLLTIFIFNSIKFIKFCKTLDSIINGANKITDNNLDYFIEEKGDIRLLSLAKNINKINRGFKVSIEEQIKNEKLKSELVANVSHDLKTPLTSIINYTDILLRDNISKEKQDEYLNILNKKSLKLKTLIEDLFEVSKINSGKLELNKTNVDVVELLNQSIAEYSDTEIYSNKNLTFILKSFKPIIEIQLDGNRMSRVFENLINNALKYSLKDSRVFVDIEPLKNGIRILFKNTSLIPLDFDKEEIFERFSRGDKSRNSNIEGSGLGLAIAKSIVELHHGNMYVDFDGDLFKIIIELYNLK